MSDLVKPVLTAMKRDARQKIEAIEHAKQVKQVAFDKEEILRELGQLRSAVSSLQQSGSIERMRVRRDVDRHVEGINRQVGELTKVVADVLALVKANKAECETAVRVANGAANRSGGELVQAQALLAQVKERAKAAEDYIPGLVDEVIGRINTLVDRRLKEVEDYSRSMNAQADSHLNQINKRIRSALIGGE